MRNYKLCVCFKKNYKMFSRFLQLRIHHRVMNKTTKYAQRSSRRLSEHTKNKNRDGKSKSGIDKAKQEKHEKGQARIIKDQKRKQERLEREKLEKDKKKKKSN